MKIVSNSILLKGRLDVNVSTLTTHIVAPIITPSSLIFLDGELLVEGIDNHYQVINGELELNFSKKGLLSIITI